MDPSYISEGISILETGVTTLALYFMLRSKAHKTYPALVGYLALSLLFGISFGILPYGPHSINGNVRYMWYFWGYWTTYLASAALLLLTIQSIFRQIMAPLPGLSRLGVLAFRWVVCISIIVAIGSSYMPTAMNSQPLVVIASEIMRCVSIIELCLLAFVTLVVQKLGLSYRSRPFGIALGFGMMASMEFVLSAIGFRHEGAFTVTNIAAQASGVLALALWAYYFAKPEPARLPVLLPISSSLLRWNEVALALGHAGAQTTATPAHEFFLSDVEKVVEKVLIKNSLKATGS